MVLSAWLCFPLALFPATPEPEVVRVGVYLNPPLSFPGLNGKAEGFIIDLMGYIAVQQDWTLHYVPCSWDECNELLSLGERWASARGSCSIQATVRE